MRKSGFLILILVVVSFMTLISPAKADDGGLQLHKISQGKDSKGALSLLSKGEELEAVDSNGSTPLLIAAEYGNTEMVTFLIEQGANIEAPNNKGWRPLHMAAYCGEIEPLVLLIKAGADIGSRNKRGCTPLHAAAIGGKSGAVDVLTKIGATVELETILMSAIEGNMGIAVSLTQKADVKVAFAIVFIPTLFFIFLTWSIYSWLFIPRRIVDSP